MQTRADHRLVYSDPQSYCAHPHGVRLDSGEILVVFNRAPRRDVVLHPPQDPAYENVLIRSVDDGGTWSEPVVVPERGWTGVECAGLTVLQSGRVLLNQWRFRWYPLSLAGTSAAAEPIALPRDLAAALSGSSELDFNAELAGDPERLFPLARGGGSAHVHMSDDDGKTWRAGAPIDTAPYSGGYGMRGAVELHDETIVLPLSDVPAYEQIFVLHSWDGGATWQRPILAAAEHGALFEEPAPLLLPSGRLLLALRENRSRSIFMAFSEDGGFTWSRPIPTGIAGYPAHLLRLGDGAVLCIYGDRRPPFSIRAVLSGDGGSSWRSEAITIRDRLPNKDLGYPFTLELPNSRLLTIYYAQDEAGITGIHASTWSL